MTTTPQDAKVIPFRLRPDDVVVEGEVIAETVDPIRRRDVLLSRAPAALLPSSRDPNAPQARRALFQTLWHLAARRAPGRFLRGLRAEIRGWWAWVMVAEYKATAMASGKYQDKAADIIATSRTRMKVTAALVVLATLATFLAWHLAPSWWLWAALAAWVAITLAVGRASDGEPAREPILHARTNAWTLDARLLNQPFREAKLLGKDEELHTVERPVRRGDAWIVMLDLPGTSSAPKALAARTQLASSLGVDVEQLHLEVVRGSGGHAGRIRMLVADSDPLAVPSGPSPLSATPEFNLWHGLPFGTTLGGATLSVQMVWTSWLVGGLPRMGKTNLGRLLTTAAALDPHCRLLIADGKGGVDFDPYQAVAHQFIEDDEDDSVAAFLALLQELKAEVQSRFKRMRSLPRELVRDSKVTEALTRDASQDFPLVLLVVDEFQNFSEHGDHGRAIVDLLKYIAKKGPAAGVMMLLLTQKPDAKAVPTELRDVIGTRAALRCATYQSSETVLGSGSHVQGYRAEDFLASHKGVMWLVGADGESDLEAGKGVLAKAHRITDEDVEAACTRGRALRVAAGTLTGAAATLDGPKPIPELLVPELLRDIVSYVDEVSPFAERVPTVELAAEFNLTETKMGRTLREWGAAPGRTGKDGPRGPRVADLRAAVVRIERGGPVKVAEGVG